MHGHKIALYYAAETTSGGTYNNIVSLCASDMELFAKPVEYVVIYVVNLLFYTPIIVILG